MFNIKEMLASKKFKVLVFTVLGIVCTALSGQIEWAKALEMMWTAALAYMGAQGIADFGKGKEQAGTSKGESGGQ